MKGKRKVILVAGIILLFVLILIVIIFTLGINSPAPVQIMNKDAGNLEIGTVWNEKELFEFKITDVSIVSITELNNLEEYEKLELIQANKKAIKINANIKNLNYDGYVIDKYTSKEVKGLDFELVCYGAIDNSVDYSPWNLSYNERCSYFEKTFPLEKGEESDVSYIILTDPDVKKLNIKFNCIKEDSTISSLSPKKIYEKVFETDIL